MSDLHVAGSIVAFAIGDCFLSSMLSEAYSSSNGLSETQFSPDPWHKAVIPEGWWDKVIPLILMISRSLTGFALEKTRERRSRRLLPVRVRVLPTCEVRGADARTEEVWSRSLARP